jgi:hypothetical protein
MRPTFNSTLFENYALLASSRFAVVCSFVCMEKAISARRIVERMLRLRGAHRAGPNAERERARTLLDEGSLAPRILILSLSQRERR